MTHQRDLTHVRTSDGPTADLDPSLAPGRAARTDHLIGPQGPRPSGLLMRKASGTASPEAEAAVGAASSSSGEQLPGELRTRFEGSLGTDLSSVRLHTGASSAAAAASVGAKAYALGNDIHFGAGHYDPRSHQGQELIAHEVAHTVQQRGGSATRQHKLEVSSPGDAHEVEADRAASAMVAGATATIGSATRGVARALHPGDPGFSPDGTDRLYKPTHWDTVAGVAPVTLGDVPPSAHFVPQFEHPILSGGMAFRGVTDSIVATLNGLAAPLLDYKKFAADAEAAFAKSGTTAHADPTDALDSSRASGAASSMHDTFSIQTQGIKGDPSKLNGAGMDVDTRDKIHGVRDRITQADAALRSSSAAIAIKANGITSAILHANAAQAAVDQALNSSKAAEVDSQIAEWKHDKEAFQQSAEIVRSGIGLITAAQKVGEKGGPAEVANAALDVVTSSANAYFTVQVAKLEKQKDSLAVANAKLMVVGAYAAFFDAKVAISVAVSVLAAANDDYEKAKMDRAELFSQLSVLIDKGLAANGATKEQRDSAESAVTAIPMIEQVVSRLDGILNSIAIPAYNDDNGLAATYCTNLNEFLPLVAAVAGYKDAAQVDRGVWAKRLTAARNVVKDVR